MNTKHLLIAALGGSIAAAVIYLGSPQQPQTQPARVEAVAAAPTATTDSKPHRASSLRKLAEAVQSVETPAQPRSPLPALDASLPLLQRLAALRDLLATGSRDDVLALISGLASLAADDASGSQLLAELASPMSPDALAAVASVVADRAAGHCPEWLELPPELGDALTEGLQAQADQAALAAALLAEWRIASPDGRQQLEGQEVPAFYAALIQEHAGTDADEAMIYATRMETCDNPATADAILALARKGALPAEELCDMMAAWSRERLQPQRVPSIQFLLHDHTKSGTERALAAFALAGLPDAVAHVPALEKAASHAGNPSLRERLNAALHLAKESADGAESE